MAFPRRAGVLLAALVSGWLIAGCGSSSPSATAGGASASANALVIPIAAPTKSASATPTAAPSSAKPSISAPPGTPLAAGNPNGDAAIPADARAVDTSHPDRVVGSGTPASCTSAAVVAAIAAGGVITFSCGPDPVTITMTATATVASASHQVVLSGGGKTQILSMNAGWQQQWPLLVVQNLAFTDAYSGTQQTSGSSVYGGGAIFAAGGQLKVVNSAFTGDNCYTSGPDLGGGAVRAVGMYPASPVYITHDTFSGNSCSNGGALSGLYAHFDVINSLLTGNKA